MIKDKSLQCILIAILSISISYLFIRPVYTSDDDILYMLTISGNFDYKPTNLLGVLYGWHPAYAWIVKTLFLFLPRFNWYTVFLISFHMAGLSAILFYLREYFTRLLWLSLFLAVFVLFDVKLLQTPDFTGSALIITVGGCLLLSLYKRKNCRYLGMLLILLGLLLRFHIAALIVLLFTPLLLYTQPSNIFKRVFPFLIIGSTWLALHEIQVLFYKKNIPDWENRTAFRDSFFSLANHPLKIENKNELGFNSTDYELLRAGFIYDSTTFNTRFFREVASEGYSPRSLFDGSMNDGFYWFYINNRIFFIFLLFIALLLFHRNRRYFWSRLLFVLLPFIIFLILTVLFKNTGATNFAFFIVLSFYFIDGLSAINLQIDARLKWYVIGLTIALLVWSIKQIAENNRGNLKQLHSFQRLAHVLQKNRDKLFVATIYNIALNGFPAWGSPSNYKFDNLLFYQRTLIRNYKTVLIDHHVTDSFPAWIVDKKVRLIGTPSGLLSQYCFIHYGVTVNFVRDGAIKYIPVYEVISH